MQRLAFGTLLPALAWIVLTATIAACGGSGNPAATAIPGGGSPAVNGSPAGSATPQPTQRPTATPTAAPRPTEEATPEAPPHPVHVPVDIDRALEQATGPVLVYAYEFGNNWHGTDLVAVYEVVTVDVGTGRQVTAFDIGFGDEQVRGLVLSRLRIIANLTSRVVSMDLNGGSRRVLYEAPPGEMVTGIAVSPDGRTVAASTVTGRFYSGPSSMVFINTNTGGLLAVRSMATLTSGGFRGVPMATRWHDEPAGVVVTGVTGTEGPGDVGFVPLSGEINRVPALGFHSVSPDGMLVANGMAWFLNMSPLGRGTPIAIVDPATGLGSELAAPATTLFQEAEWSPAGKELLLTAVPEVPTGDDKDRGAWYLAKPVQAGWALEGPVDPAAVRLGWYGARLVESACGSERAPLYVSWDGYWVAACHDQGSGVGLAVGGRVVARALQTLSVQVLGFVAGVY